MPADDLREIEATLLILSEDPLSVVAGIGALPSVAGYPLIPQESLSINDYYFDTPDKLLRAADFSLRVREVNASPWLTIKGPPTPIAPGLVERLELEVPWSETALTQIAGELARRGLRIPSIFPAKPGGPPAKALASLGLEQVQHRENLRQIRNILSPDPPGAPLLAELSIDSVVYHFKKRRVRHYEVELEAKSQGGIALLSVVAQSLLDLFPTTLQRWEDGKLATGRAIETLLVQWGPEALLNDRGQLTPAAYTEIQRFLGRDSS